VSRNAILGVALLAGHLDAPGLSESSGLVASRRQPGLFWTHNDSGNAAQIFAIDGQGHLRGRFAVEGARNVDWEAITIDADGHLWIGDIGDNLNRRDDQRLLRVDEPTVPLQGPPVEGTAVLSGSLAVRFADRPDPPTKRLRNWDAEGLFWADGSPWILTKHRDDTETTLYRVPRDAALAADGRVVALSPVDSFDVGGADKPYGGMVSSAESTPDGRRLAVLTYHALFVFEGDPARGNWLRSAPRRFDFDQAALQQCEAVAWDGDGLLVTNEAGGMFRFR
jgi:hypothetical protein